MVYDHDEDFEDDLVEIKGEMIEWKIGQNYLVKVENQEERMPSFLWLFKSFKAIDFINEEEDEVHEMDLHQTSDLSLFNQNKEIVKIFRDYFYQYLIPNAYGVYIEEFQAPIWEDEDQNSEPVPIK